MVSGYVPTYCPRCGGRLASRWVEEERQQRLVCQRCGQVEYLNPKLAACTIPRVGDRILLVRRAIEPGRGKWVFPGGYVDLGETVQDAAVREVYEETGVRVELERLLDAYSYPGSAVVVLVYVGRVVEGEPAPGAECLEVRLFAPEEIPWDELAFRSTREALCRYLDSRAPNGDDGSMTLAEVQQRVHAWIDQFEEGYWPPLANLARLSEEVGELARELNDRFGPKRKRPGTPSGSVEEELGDILFVLACLANSLDLDLGRCLAQALAKYERRDRDRWRRRDA